MPCWYGIIRILGIVAFFAYRRLQSLSETVKSNPIHGVMRRLPHGTARRSPRQSGSHCSERLVREPAAFYVRSRDHLDVVADDPDCYLPGAPAAPEVVPVHFLDCPKDGLDYAALVVPVHEPGQLVPARSGHITLGLAAPVLADGVGLGPDARYHALVGYGVTDLPCQVGRVRAEEAGTLFDPSQHRLHSGDV